MTDSQSFENESIVPKQSEAITSLSLDEFKSFFYQYNAKPDTEIRLLKDVKIVELADIFSLEEQVTDKLRNHTIVAKKVEIFLFFHREKSKNFLPGLSLSAPNGTQSMKKLKHLA